MIIDASVAFKWIAREEDSELALRLLDGRHLVAPILMIHEVGNAIWKMAQREQIDSSVSFSEDLARLPLLVELVDESQHAPRALEIGREFNHAVYDCAYLAMAESRSDRIVSADATLMTKLSGTRYASMLVSLEEALS